MSRLLLTVTAVAAIASAVNGGVFFAFSTFVMDGINRLSPAASIRAMQGINVSAPRPPFMALFLGTAALSIGLAVTAIARWSEPWAPWVLAGALLYLVAIVMTAAFHVPRNNALDLVDPATVDAARTWESYRSAWVLGNHVRTLSPVLAAACYLVAMRAG